MNQMASASATRPMPPAMEAVDWALYGITVFVWGTSWIALRAQLGVVAPEVSLVWRFAMAGLIMFAWVFWRGSE